MSASCSIDPDSLKSDNIGLWSALCSGALDNCDNAITVIPSSLAIFFNSLDILATSCSLD
ncbi:hypothetical protein D3C76_1643600 [compost metagenome]